MVGGKVKVAVEVEVGVKVEVAVKVTVIVGLWEGVKETVALFVGVAVMV